MGHWFSNFTLDQSKSVPIFDDFWRIDIDFRRISLISSRARVPCWWIMSLNINKMPHLNSIIIQLKQTVLSDKWIFNHLNASGNKPWWKSMMQQCFFTIGVQAFSLCLPLCIGYNSYSRTAHFDFYQALTVLDRPLLRPIFVVYRFGSLNIT